MRCVVAFVFLWVAAACAMAAQQPAAAAQQAGAGGLGGYGALRLDEAGVFVGGFDGSIERLSGGVKITLLPAEAGQEPLPISAQEMTFTWSQDSKRPTRILLQGKVVIDHPKATVRAEKADWDLAGGILTFTGDPVMSTPQVQELRGQKVVLNFNTNRFEVYGGTAKEITLAGGGNTDEAAANPYLLRDADITDWAGFLTRVKTEAAAKAASPGKRLVALLDPKTQQYITTVPAETLLGDKAAILKQLNKVLADPRFYEKSAWAGVALAPELQEAVGQGPVAPENAVRVNRALLEAAYPDLVAARRGDS